MSESRSRALCLLLTILAPALIAMHSLVTSPPATPDAEHSVAQDESCQHEMPCDEVHLGTHACVGVLAAAVVVDADEANTGDTPSVDIADHAARERQIDGHWPPWTTPTTAELSIWRV